MAPGKGVCYEARDDRVRARAPNGESRSWRVSVHGPEAWNLAREWLAQRHDVVETAPPVQPMQAVAPSPGAGERFVSDAAAGSTTGGVSVVEGMAGPATIIVDNQAPEDIRGAGEAGEDVEVALASVSPDAAPAGTCNPDSDTDVCAELCPPVPLNPVVAQMTARALEVSRLGQYWGFFDWIMWGHATSCRVWLWFGHELVDLFETFCPGHPCPPGASGRVVNVAACLGLQVAQGALPGVNHFILLEPFAEQPPPTVSVSDWGAHLAAERKHWDPQDAADLAAFYMDLGFACVHTASTGDCAPDACVLFEGGISGPMAWKTQRTRVAAAIQSFCCEPWAQEAFGACQEGAAAVLVASPAAPQSEAPAPPPPALPPVTPDRELEEPPSESQPADAPPNLPAAAPAAPQAAGDTEMDISKEALSWAFARTGAISSEAEQGQVIATWLSKIADEELAEIKREYIAAQIPRNRVTRTYQSSLLCLRFRVGRAYIEWKRDHPESSACLRDFALQHFGAGPGGRIAKKTRVFIARCERLALNKDTYTGDLGKGYKRKATTMQTGKAKRRRLHLTQGRPCVAPELRNALFQWFVDTRASIKGRFQIRTTHFVGTWHLQQTE